MSTITITKSIELKEPLHKSAIVDKIENALRGEFKKVKITENNGEYTLNCRVKTNLFNPIVSIKSPINIQLDGNTLKLMINSDIKTNGWFWFTFLIGFLFPLIWILMIWMFISQKKSSVQSINNVFDRLEFDLGGEKRSALPDTTQHQVPIQHAPIEEKVVAEPQVIKAEFVSVIVRVNGEVCSAVVVPIDSDDKTAISEALKDITVKKYLKENHPEVKKLRKSVCVQNQTVDLIV